MGESRCLADFEKPPGEVIEIREHRKKNEQRQQVALLFMPPAGIAQVDRYAGGEVANE